VFDIHCPFEGFSPSRANNNIEDCNAMSGEKFILMNTKSTLLYIPYVDLSSNACNEATCSMFTA